MGALDDPRQPRHVAGQPVNRRSGEGPAPRPAARACKLAPAGHQGARPAAHLDGRTRARTHAP
eukprot:2358988-Alexandrium_andersonii.AAC.1